MLYPPYVIVSMRDKQFKDTDLWCDIIGSPAKCSSCFITEYSFFTHPKICYLDVPL